jgi:ligand-binding sensor protein
MDDAELLESAQQKVDRAIRLDLWDVSLTLDEVHAILHAQRPSWCNQIRAHERHRAQVRGTHRWCGGNQTE